MFKYPSRNNKKLFKRKDWSGEDHTSDDLSREAEAEEDDELDEVEKVKSCLSDEGGDVETRGVSLYLIIG